MASPVVFLSAASIDLKEWREVLHGAFSRAGFRVLTQDQSLRSALGDVKRLLTETIDESDCIIHLAGLGYGSDATEPFAEAPGFQCSWTQFEYYHGHREKKDLIAFVCAPDLSAPGFVEEGETADVARKQRLQQEHRARVASGMFDGTPLAGKVGRTSNEQVDSVQALLKAVAAAVGTLHWLGDSARAAGVELDFVRSLHQLPPRPEGFVGREGDLAKLRALNPASGAVLTGLRGMGGIGKTALALVLAHEWAARFPDAQLFLDARGTQPDPPSAGDLLARVIQAFHPTAKLPEDEAALKGIYHEVLGGKKVLILLDNARDAAQAAPLIPPAGCALIVTSRHSFMLRKSAPINVGRLPDTEAAALLREYHPALADADIAALVQLCAGLPLALRLAGAHLALDATERGGGPDVAGYLRALGGGRLATLDAEAADAGEVTISETLRLSEAQLPEPEREAWHALGVFTADFDARAAKAIAGADETMLGHFVRRSLLEHEGVERFKLHDLAADYARAQLTDTARTGLHLAHARYYTAVSAEATELYFKGDVVGGLALFDRERVQIETAYGRLSGDHSEIAAQQLFSLVDAVVHTGNLRFHPEQRIAWSESQLRAARRLKNRTAEGMVLSNLGMHHFDLGDTRKAIEYHEQRLAIARETGSRQGEGAALSNLGLARAVLGDVRKSIVLFEQALAIAREFRDARGENTALGNLGNAYTDLNDARKAIECHEEALAISVALGDPHAESQDLGNLGLAYVELGNGSKAIECFERALVISQEIGDRRGEGSALGNLGFAHLSFGDPRKTIEYCEKQLKIAREVGDRRGEGNGLGNLGLAFRRLGDAKKAIALYEQQAIINREIGYRVGEGNALWNTAITHDSLGNRTEAIARAAAALAIYEAIEDPNAAQVRAALAEWRA